MSVAAKKHSRFVGFGLGISRLTQKPKPIDVTLMGEDQVAFVSSTFVERRRISPGLDVAVAGPRDGTPLVFHHGSPGSLVLFEPFIEAVVGRGLRFVSYSRPGYGTSTRQPGRIVADCATDTANIVNRLGAERFYVIGWSGGGPHALACAALLPQRVIAASTIASPAPYGAKNLNWQAGQSRETIEKAEAAHAGRTDELQSLLEHEEPLFAQITGDQIITAFSDLPDADKATLTGQLGAFLAGNIREAYRNGIWGLFDDNIAFANDWGCNLGLIKIPVAVWQGDKDRMVPFAHGQWLASNVSNAQAHLLIGEGHLSLAVGYFDKILDNLIANGKRSRSAAKAIH